MTIFVRWHLNRGERCSHLRIHQNVVIVLKSQVQQWSAKREESTQAKVTVPWSPLSCSVPGEPPLAPRAVCPVQQQGSPAVFSSHPSAKPPVDVSGSHSRFSHTPISCYVPSSPQLLWQSVTCPTLNPALPTPATNQPKHSITRGRGNELPSYSRWVD